MRAAYVRVSSADLLTLTGEFRSKGVFLVSNKENIDSSTATGKLMLAMIAAINEFERANIRERQKEGIEIAKKRGVYKRNFKRATGADIRVCFKAGSTNSAKALGLYRDYGLIHDGKFVNVIFVDADFVVKNDIFQGEAWLEVRVADK